jgi:hypothetical protein
LTLAERAVADEPVALQTLQSGQGRGNFLKAWIALYAVLRGGGRSGGTTLSLARLAQFVGPVKLNGRSQANQLVIDGIDYSWCCKIRDNQHLYVSCVYVLCLNDVTACSHQCRLLKVDLINRV